MKTVANQNIGIIHKDPCDKENLYATINLEALHNAMADLGSSPAFHLWMYFAKNQDGYTFAVSPAATLSWGVPRASFYKALQTLKEKKYIVEKSDNTYDFYESPKEEQIVVTINKDNSFVF